MQSRSHAYKYNLNVCVCIPIKNMRSDHATLLFQTSTCNLLLSHCNLSPSVYVRQTAVPQSLWCWVTFPTGLNQQLFSKSWLILLRVLPGIIALGYKSSLTCCLKPVDWFPRWVRKHEIFGLWPFLFKFFNAYLPTWGGSTLASPSPGKISVKVVLPGCPSPPGAFLQSEFNAGDRCNWC